MSAQLLSKILSRVFFPEVCSAFPASVRVLSATGTEGGRSSIQTCQPALHTGCVWVAVALAAPAAPVAPVTMALETFSRLLHIPGKKMLGANTFFCRNLAWPSPSPLACSSTHLPTKRLINVYFFSCFHMVCSQAFACVCMNAHLHWLLWGNCSTNAGHLQINACT